ncbi:hypothetical protein [Halalkalibacter krulwichiae]|uniref:Uncharacterized protein n=1 Tax=Halalkalibacter krulwichiae TaxID=199441 RepID=A0A1X9M8N9_9BACI|nr:hypothetical protein [Halalkalibacter krulwichiae]ARK29819.1 hypothetical protein BkAM31D_08075 [Halalkalibacter krulwichiae]
MYQVNETMVIEKMDEHFCLVKEAKGKKTVEMCFSTIEDALSYSFERKYCTSC